MPADRIRRIPRIAGAGQVTVVVGGVAVGKAIREIPRDRVVVSTKKTLPETNDRIRRYSQDAPRILMKQRISQFFYTVPTGKSTAFDLPQVQASGPSCP